ncbi:MAG: DUF4292 domain-containing protein [Bacteroidales bacterium]
MNSQIHKRINSGILLLAGILLFSCTPGRKIIKQPIKEEGIDYVFGKLKKNEFNFLRFNAKFNASVEIDKKKSTLSGQVRILHDSLIWVSITPALGLEAARILISLDSVLFINRINNTYMRADFTFINDNLNSGFDFDLLQALLIGNDLSFYENDKFKVSVDEMKYRLSTVGRRKLKRFIRNQSETQKVLIQNIWVEAETGKIAKVHTKELGKENKKLEIEYSNFQAVGDQSFPEHIEVRIEAEKKIKVSLDFSKIKLDEPTSFPFSIPAKYTPMLKN